MKKIMCILLIAVMLSGCETKQKVVQPPSINLSVEQTNSNKEKVNKLLAKKSWTINENINYLKTTLPKTVDNTYYKDILAKSKDGGFNFSKYLGKDIAEGIVNIRYSNGDIAGVGHFLFYNNNLVGAYYMVGNYIYSLNERDVFKKNINWSSVENIQKTAKFKDSKFQSAENLINWGKDTDNKSYIFEWANSKLRILYIDKEQFVLKNEIELKDLYVVNIFFKDIDNDKVNELGILTSTNQNWWESGSKSELLIYSINDKLKRKYSISFEQPIWSADFDGKNIIVTSESSIEMYALYDSNFKKDYSYNKVGGIIKVEDIDKSGVKRYILLDSKGTDIYVFQWNSGLEEIWRSYNTKSEFEKDLQVADLNDDGIKEIYILDKLKNTRKLILAQNGFVFKKDEVKKGRRIFTGDFDSDEKYEYFDMTLKKNQVTDTLYKDYLS